MTPPAPVQGYLERMGPNYIRLKSGNLLRILEVFGVVPSHVLG